MSDRRSQLEAMTPAQRARLGNALGVVGGGGGRLLAYVTGDCDPAVAKQQVAVRLPKHAVPSVITPLVELPKLPNGKIDRNNLPKPQAREVPATPDDVGANEAEETLRGIWQEVLGVEVVELDDDFFEIGGDSILSIQIVSRARSAGLNIAPDALADHPTVRSLAATAGSSGGEKTLAAPTDGRVPLSPIQRWFFELGLAEPGHWNQAYAFDVDLAWDEAAVRDLVCGLFEKHEQLRAGFCLIDGEWEQRINPGVTAGEVLSFGKLDAEMVGGFALDGSPVVRFGHTRGRLLVVAHHLVIDQFSWGVLAHDIGAGSEIDVSLPETSYANWVAELPHDELPPTASAKWGRLPRDGEGGGLIEANSRVTDTKFDGAALFSSACEAYQTKVHELLLTALAMWLRSASSADCFRVGTESHGRDGKLDVGGTVGWFTRFYPVRLILAGNAELGDAVKAVKEQVRAAESAGLAHAMARFGDEPEPREVAGRDEAAEEVLFNYLGTAVSVPGAAPVSDGCRSGSNRRPHLVEVNAWRSGDVLHVRWVSNSSSHDEATVVSWSNQYLELLSSVVEHCASSGAGGYTPSDFASSGLDQGELDDFLDNL